MSLILLTPCQKLLVTSVALIPISSFIIPIINCSAPLIITKSSSSIIKKLTSFFISLSLSHTILNSYNQYLYAVYNIKSHNIIYYDHSSLIQSILASPFIKNQIAKFHTSILNMKIFL